MRYLATDILPLVRRRYPGSQLRVIGRMPARQRAYWQRFPGLLVLGEVASIAQAARGGGVGVCAMRLGAGVQNKLLEYMALGLPAVTTTIGLQGISAKPGQEVVLADTPQAFAQAVIDLLDNRVAARILAQAARQHVERHHTWTSVLAPMVQTIQHHVAASASLSPRQGGVSSRP